MEAPISSYALSLIDALFARGPADDRAHDQFVSSWDGTVIVYRANEERFESTCEVHFGWALAGRAVQDVWIVPSRRSRPAGESDRMYGTTLRIYIAQHDEWQIIWSDLVRQANNRMTGRRVGLTSYRSIAIPLAWSANGVSPRSRMTHLHFTGSVGNPWMTEARRS
jgi:hypothetical protein